MSPKDPSEQGWQKLTRVGGPGLGRAREQCHWATQVLAAVGYAHLERADDDSQSNAGWVDGMQILAGRLVASEPPYFVSLAVADLTLALHEPGGDALVEVPLHGLELEEAFEAISMAIAERTQQPTVRLKLPSYEMPAFSSGNPVNFDFFDADAFAEFARWMHDANLVLLDLSKASSSSTVPRVWPHHFDMGMLISPPAAGGGAPDQSIGVGLSPGDGSYPDPYWYVSPHPQPEGALPPLSSGHWHTAGWTGAVLSADEIWDAGSASDQESLVRSYLESTVAAARQLLPSVD